MTHSSEPGGGQTGISFSNNKVTPIFDLGQDPKTGAIATTMRNNAPAMRNNGALLRIDAPVAPIQPPAPAAATATPKKAYICQRMPTGKERAANKAAQLTAALRYAQELDYKIVILHAPLFDGVGTRTRCTCEANKRSENYRQWLITRYGNADKFDPNYQCPTPGKHPRLRDWESEASSDPAIIRGWFAKWPLLNIGVAAGLSGLVILDGDKYKEDFAGHDLLTQADKETATQLSGGGGEHEFYQMPPGADYGNEKGALPAGIDIRGNGGMVVLAPSIHPTGKEYAWELGYSPFECPPAPLPPALKTILDEAQVNSVKAKPVTFTKPTTERPDLAQWQLGRAIRELIDTPKPRGQRSEADASVITSLVYAGATDDQILGVFEHYPIGTKGKYAEGGVAYLAHSIGRARAYMEAHPRVDVPATLDPLRLWVRTHSFEPFIPEHLRRAIYRTDGTDTKVADAVFDAMVEDGRLTVTLGKRRLGKLAGCSPNTALATLARLTGWLFDVTPDTSPSSWGLTVALVDKCRIEHIDPLFAAAAMTKRGQSTANDKTTSEYSERKASDPFARGVSRPVKKQLLDVIRVTGESYKAALESYTVKAFGEGGLRVLDALGRCGDMTAAELATETGKKVASVRTACQHLEAHNLIESTREGSRGPKVYTLTPDWKQKLAEITPDLRTYGMGAWREDSRLVASLQWNNKALDPLLELEKKGIQLSADQHEEKRKLTKRGTALTSRRMPQLKMLYPGLTEKERFEFALDAAAPRGPHPGTVGKMSRLHAESRLNLTESRRAADWELAKLLTANTDELKATGTPKKQWFAILTTAGFTPNEASRAIAAAR